ncbi:MAG: hypothetical protein KDK10_10645 [Maritimibacter sp.]|nr:hypothetical protein [Maritimibacter sp.]
MTNRLAIFLAVIVLGIFLADRIYFGGQLPVLIGRKGLAFIEWLAFWR